MNYPRHHLLPIAASIILATTACFAQGDKVIIRLLPKPNQTVRFEMTQEMNMDVVYEGAPDVAGQASSNVEKMTGKSIFAFTQKNGALNDQGKMEAQVTYDRLIIEQSMNGKTVPVDEEVSKLVGKTIVLTFDGEGNILDVKVPPEVEVPAETLKQMMASMYSNLPKTPVAVGETAAMPFSMALPIPSPGPDPLNLEGQTKYRLLSVDKESEGSLARFEQTVEAVLLKTFDVTTAEGKGKASVDFKLTGAGALRLDPDKGILKTGEMLTTIDGTMTVSTLQAKPQTVRLHGTTKMSSTGRN